MHVEPVAVVAEPRPNLAVLMIRRIVLHQDRAATAVVESKLPQEPQVRHRVEDFVPSVVKLSAVDLDCPENLNALAFSGYEDHRRPPDRAPRGVEG